ncbi:hypothetical protein KOW_01150 [Bacillus cereus VDM006]|nr:hypothetical protein KOW_01150 [Bacillus cereus VDM006]
MGQYEQRVSLELFMALFVRYHAKKNSKDTRNRLVHRM